MSTTEHPTSASSVVRRDWVDDTIRFATSRVGLFTAYVAGLILALYKFKEFAAAIRATGLPGWAGIGLIAAFPISAFVFSTIPTLIEQHRLKRTAEITIDPEKKLYFTLRPRNFEDGCDRLDNAHQGVLNWIENTKEPILYLTGASGTGKSSVLAAWAVPILRDKGHIVIELRGYEQILERIKESILKPGLIWAQPPNKDPDLRSLLNRAHQRLSYRRLIIIVDQFEEFLILTERVQQEALRQFLCEIAIDGVTFLLVYRSEYEGLIEEQAWPKPRETNRKEIFPFTEPAAKEFLRKSGLTVHQDLMGSVLHEAAEIEQGTPGLIRPVTVNLCGLVLSRFASGLPRKFRGGIIRGFLRESLLLLEVRDVAEKIIPELITSNVTKRPRRIAEIASASGLSAVAIKRCLRRLGQADRGIVRPLDEQEDIWEISHDFLVPLLDALIARRIVSVWRRIRPWLPWAAAAALGMIAVAIPLLTKQDATVALRQQGWTISQNGDGSLQFKIFSGLTEVPSESISILATLSSPYSLDLSSTPVADISVLKDLKSLTFLDLRSTKVADVSVLKDLKSLTSLNLSSTPVADVSVLKDLKSLTSLDLSSTPVADVSALKDLKSLTSLDLTNTKVADVSALKDLKSLTSLDLTNTKVADVSVLKDLKSLTSLNLSSTPVADVSVLKDLKSLTSLNLSGTRVADLSVLKDLKSLTSLNLSSTPVADVSVLKDLKSLTFLYLSGTRVADVSALKDLKSLTFLYLSSTPVADLSVLKDLKSLTSLDLTNTKVADVSVLKDLKSLTSLNLSSTPVADLSVLKDLKSLTFLDLSSTPVADVSALKDLKSLIVLNLRSTPVADLSVLKDLKSLTFLYLSGTRVADVSVLRRNGLTIMGP